MSGCCDLRACMAAFRLHLVPSDDEFSLESSSVVQQLYANVNGCLECRVMTDVTGVLPCMSHMYICVTKG